MRLKKIPSISVIKGGQRTAAASRTLLGRLLLVDRGRRERLHHFHVGERIQNARLELDEALEPVSAIHEHLPEHEPS